MAAAHPLVEMGPERVPLLIVDDAHPEAAALRDQALAAAYAAPDGDLYPGVRAPVSHGYGAWLATVAGQVAGEAGITVLRSTFAVATLDPAAAAPIQRIPHFDTTDSSVIAAVHYLCEPPHGGTSFYRHRRTGYQRIDASRASAWRQALARDRRDFGMPDARFPEGDDASFERVRSAALGFNRLILYPANCLHSGDLGPNAGVAGAAGRLTITSLLRLTKPGGTWFR